MPPQRTERLYSRQEASPDWIRQQIASRRTATQDSALYSPLSLFPRLNRQAARPTPQNLDYIDLTQDDEDPTSGITDGDCLAYCHRCKPRQHLKEPFNRSFAQCPCCFNVERTSQFPCTCPLPDHDAILRESNPDLAAELEAFDGPRLSNLAKRVLLLVAQVPPGRYTTYIALNDVYRDRWGMTSRKHMGSALKKSEWWEVVPVHRVLAKNASIGSSVDWGEHGQDLEERIELLEDEGMRFDSRGKLLGASFTEFR